MGQSDINKAMLRSAVDRLERLEAVEGRKAKEDILKDGKDDAIFKKMLRMALGGDVYNVTVQLDVESSDESRFEVTDSYNKFLRLTKALRDRKLTGNKAVDTTNFFLSACHPKLRKWFARIINHDMRIGVGKTTVEKVYGTAFWGGEQQNGGISWHFHGCMAAKKYDKVYRKKSPAFPQAAEMKLDGERALLFVFPSENSVKVFTRGKKRKLTIEGVSAYCKQVIEYVKELNRKAGFPEDTPQFIDGEFLALDWNSTSSIVGRTKNFDQEKFLKEVRTVIWDWSPVEDYVKGSFDLQWKRRKAILMMAAGLRNPTRKLTKVSDNLYVLGHHPVYSEEELQGIYERAVDKGFEGIMLKRLESPHVFHRRHKYVVKLKPEDAETGTIIEVVAATDKANGPARDQDRKSVYRCLSEYGDVQRDGYYLHLPVESEEQAKIIVDKLKSIVHDAVDRRISTHRDGYVSYRYSCRLRRFIVEKEDGRRFAVGGGFSHTAGDDQRMDFWQRREELLGMKVDFKKQGDPSEVAVARFNNFVRLREDL